MPYSTELPDGFISLDTNGLPVVDLAFVSVLNDFGPAQEFDIIDVPGEQGLSTLTHGDDFDLRESDGSLVDSGTYMGDITLSTADVSLSLLAATVTVELNPIDGELYEDENGDFFMLTDAPLTEDHLGVTVTISPLIGSDIVLNLKLSEVADSLPIVGTLAAPLVQQVLDTALVSLDVDATGTLDFEDTDVPCFAAGTEISTAAGIIPVEQLKVGDRVITRDNGYQVVRWIGRAEVSARTLRHHPNLRPIRISKDALAPGLPHADLLVSPQHRILLRSKVAKRMFKTSEVLVPAVKLLAHPGVTRIDDCTPLVYYHFLFDKHEIVYANCAPAESLFLGQQALVAVGDAARQEIFGLFPELRDPDARPGIARPVPPGNKVERFLERHHNNQKALYS